MHRNCKKFSQHKLRVIIDIYNANIGIFLYDQTENIFFGKIQSENKKDRKRRKKEEKKMSPAALTLFFVSNLIYQSGKKLIQYMLKMHINR